MLCFKSKSLPYLNSATVIIYQAACKYTLVKIYLQYEQINFYKGRDILREINRVTNIFRVEPALEVRLVLERVARESEGGQMFHGGRLLDE